MRIKARRQVEEISNDVNSERVHFGFLAEDYDGIGQYVLTTLARTSSAAAYKAHVASGDFGTGQTIPAGTQVTVVSVRGRLEIVSLGAK